MKDKWINSGFEGEDLKPHIEPVEDYSDTARIGELPGNGAAGGPRTAPSPPGLFTRPYSGLIR